MNRVRTFLSAALLAALPFCATAFEAPPVSSARQVLGAAASGPNYRVEEAVPGDGLLHIFTLTTELGSYQVAGDALMRERIAEMGALARLDAMSTSDVFLDSLGQSATAPIRFGKDLLDDPDATLKRSASGVKQMFNRVGTGISNRKASRDSAMGGLLGVDAAKRRLAVALGVDPYTDFPPLAARLNDVASAAAAGGLSVKVLTMAIPGAVGMAASSGNAVENIRATLAERTSAEIAVIVKAQLQALRVPPATADLLVLNRAYTPTDLLVMAQALTALNADATPLFVERAAGALTRDEAFFQRQRAVLLAQNAAPLGIGAFVDVGGFPLNRLADGRIIAVLPVDLVAWTEGVARAVEVVDAAADAASARPVLALTGTLTAEASAGVEALGWEVVALR